MGIGRKLTLVILSMGLLIGAMQRAEAQSLADALVAAYRNSDLLEQNRALLRATDEDVVQAEAALRPVVNFITGANANWRRIEVGGVALPTESSLRLNFSLVAEMTLFDFGRAQLGVAFAREQVLSARAGLVSVEQQVLLRAVQAFLGVVRARDEVALRRSNLELIREELRAARQRFELGDSTRTDIAIAEARLAAAESLLAAAEGDFNVAREDYRLATGSYPNRMRQPPQLPRLPATMQQAMNLARSNHPAITQAQHQVAAADLMVETARAARRGAVRGELSAGIIGQGDTITRDLSAGVTYAVPIYQGGRLNSNERQAVAQREARRAELNQQVAQIMQSVGSSWAQLEVARARLAASRQQIEAAETAYEAVRAEAELGSRTSLDVLNAEQELLDARSGRIAASAGLQLAAYALLESTGQLTVEALNLGIPTYDVEAYGASLRGAGRPRAQPSEQGRRLDRILERYGQD